MSIKVLLLSTYPILNPRHGGQVRVSNIKKVYENNGFQVINFALYEPESYSKGDVESLDMPFEINSPYRKFEGKLIPLITDLQSGEYVSKDDAFFQDFVQRIPNDIDVIHIEQPWLWPLINRLQNDFLTKKPILIYGSQNIEWLLKKDILDSYSISDSELVVEKIKQLEITAALEADITCAVTENDVEILSGFGARNVTLARNGIAKWKASAEKLKYWKERLPKSPWILYVASGHPPNFKGFKACVGDSLACIPPDSKLVVVGSVCESLYNQLIDSDYSSINQDRLQLLYMLSDEDLAAVKELATAFLLPIPHGGGSNIKTAEALYSNKYVIATETALRGYERYANSNKLIVCSSTSEFMSSIRCVLSEIEINAEMQDQDDKQDLLWDNCLQIIPVTVKKLIKEK
ncbi:glycosyltransferase family protein [Yersinia massiliensis]|uniref:hypothetical protein n=1 Tax=Yersinia massiliensis TaxID=419257 RepID=UPI001CFCCE25|nr:hypothetical protein [Yersinia massiliensis]MCB5306752.1 hypothetical protein [Yersinia massiliensis]